LMNAPLSLHSCYITTKTAITINGGGLVVNGTTIVSGGASCLISNAAMLATIISLFSNKPVDGSITNVIKNPVLVIDAGVSSVCGDATAADIRRFK